MEGIKQLLKNRKNHQAGRKLRLNCFDYTFRSVPSFG